MCAADHAAPPLTIHLFGPFEARVNGVPLPRLRTRKGQWVLALLALRHGRDVERSWLAGTLWPDSDEQRAHQSLRMALTDLRRALGAEAWRILAPTNAMLRLDLSDAEVDVIAFDAAVERGAREERFGRGADTGGDAKRGAGPRDEVGGGGRAPGAERGEPHLEAGRPSASKQVGTPPHLEAGGPSASIQAGTPVRAALEEALRHYRGPLLEGCVEEWAFPERQAREEAYLGALERLAEVALAAAQPEVAAGYLRRAAAVDPLRESAQRALMAALAASGSYAATTDVYREFRRRLHRELNAEPSPETRALFERLRSEARQRALRGGLGLERPSLQVPEDVQPPNLEPGSGPRGNLPQPWSAFIGRERELQEIGACLASARLVTLTGTGGIGKTRLAIRVAEEHAWEYADGAWFVDLAALADAALVPQAVARALRVPEAPGSPLMETLQEALGARQLLLVLDNCEHLLDTCASLADTLLSGCPHLRVLATSRQPLGLTGEVARRVPSLSLPDPGVQVSRCPGVQDQPDRTPEHPNTRTPEHLMRSAAVRLFVERARAAEVSFEMTPHNAPAIAQVCRRLDGIPLAIELAAARVQAIPVDMIAARLDDRFHLLTGGSRTALPRQQTLRASFDWSYDLLSEPERLLMRRLSVFAGGWTLEAAETVCAWGASVECQVLSVKVKALSLPGSTLNTQHSTLPLEEGDVLDVLTSLVKKSLVVYEEQDGGPLGGARYRMLETVRQYFSERLLEAGEREATRERHLEFFLALTEEAEPQLTGAQQGEWLERLETELDNLRAALAFASSDAGGQKAEGRRQKAGSVDAAGSSLSIPPELPSAFCLLPSVAEGGLRLAGALGRFWNARGSLTEGRELLAQALGSAPGATAGRAKALETAGGLACRQADYQSARSLQEESLAICRELGDLLGIADSLRNLGMVANSQGDHVAARSFYEQSLAISRELGDRSAVAASLRNLGMVAYQNGEYGAARSLQEESLAIRRELGDRLGIADSLRILGMVAYQRGEYGVARSLQEESLAIKRELGDRYGSATSLKNLGQIAYAQGEYGAARSLYEESLAIKRESGDRLGIADALNNLGMVAYALGEYEAARSLQEESLAIRRDLADRYGIAASLSSLGLVAYAQGQYGAARALHEDSLALRRELGHRLGIATSLAALAELACKRQGQPGAAEVAGAGGRLPEVEAADLAGAGWRAACLFGAAEALREAIGAPLPPNEQNAYRRQVSRLRLLLEEEAFAAAWAEGRAMTLEHAVAYALGETREG